MRRIVLPIVYLCAGAALLTTACWDDMSGPPPPADPDFRRGFAGGANARMQSPVRIAEGRSGMLVVSDPRQGRLFEVDAATLTVRGTVKVGGRPLAVGTAGNRIFVGNEETQTVDVYSTRGRFRYSFAGRVAHPLDMAVDEQLGLVFVVDAGDKDVKIFDVRGDLQGVIDNPTEPLRFPAAIAVDVARREVLVSDYPENGGNAAVLIYGYDGAFRARLSPGRCGIIGCSGGFSRPQGIAVDGRGRIYLVDAFLAQVLVYDRSTLAVVAVLGGRDAGPPELHIPLDVAISGTDLFVTSNRNARVEAFRDGVVSP